MRGAEIDFLAVLKYGSLDTNQWAFFFTAIFVPNKGCSKQQKKIHRLVN